MTSPRFGDPRLNEIYHYWLSKRRDGKPPRRADIKASELGATIRNLNIIEVLRDPLRFRHRLVGTHHIEWLGRDATGQMLDETLYGAATAEVVANLSHIVETGLPFHCLERLDWNNQKYLMMESVEMPLSDDAHDVAMILRGSVFRYATEEDTKRLVFEPLS